MKNLLYSLVFYTISAIGISLTIISNIGVSSFNSMNMAISSLTSIKVGAVTTLVNCVFLVLCFILDHKKDLKKYLTMIIALLLFGYIINFFVYCVFNSIDLNTYLAKLSVFVLGVLIAGIGTGQVVYYQTLSFPIERFCEILSNKTKHSFKFYRYSVDVFSVSVSLCLSLIFHLSIFVREGTVISLFLLSVVIAKSRDFRLCANKKQYN